MRYKDWIAAQLIALLLERGQATRGEILKRLPIRPATLLELVQGLVRDGVLEEPQRKGARTGRRASPLRLRPDQACFLGIDLDFPQTLGVCLDAAGEVVAEARRDSPSLKTRKRAQREIEEVVADLRRQIGARWRKVRGVGFADPGLVNAQDGVSIRAVNLEGWEGLPTARWLEQVTGVPSRVFPDTAAHAYAESLALAGDSRAGLLYLQLDTGIGGGFVRGGIPLLGDSHCAMEIGHLIIREGGPLCQCGNRGCMEALAGFQAIRRRVEELNEQGVQTMLDGAHFSFVQLAECTRAGDKAAQVLVQEVAGHLGVAVAMAVTLLNPRAIVLGGGLTRVGAPLLDGVRNVLTLRCLPDALKGLVLKISDLPAHATARGAALLVRRQRLLEKWTSPALPVLGQPLGG